MKFGKEEIQKLVLGALMVIGLVYCYFSMLLFPLQAQQQAARKALEEMRPEISNARGQIRRTHELEQSAPARTLVVRQVDAMIPEGSPVAWFPTHISDVFKQQGIEKSATRLSGEVPDKDLTGFRRLAWAIDLPKIEFNQFGAAICALENEEPLIQISSMQVDASREDVETQRALLTVNNIVKP